MLAMAAVGMWRARYWAVLGFQALLALLIVICVAVPVDRRETICSAIVALVVDRGARARCSGSW